MSLTPEWEHRIERWQRALWESCYRPLGTFTLGGFTTLEHLTADQAVRKTYYPMPPGTRWGAKWEYGWFTGEFSLPEEAAGRRIVLRMDPGGESLVWVNGKVAGSYGWAHKEITLTREGKPGEHYAVLLEAYAGHGPINVGERLVRYGTLTVPEPGPTQTAVEESSFGIWLEDVYQLAVDFSTLYELRENLDPLTLRVSEIDEALMDATLIIDLELPEAEMLETVKAGREKLKPILACVNGSTMPTFYGFGHAHLDVAWLWPWAETRRKIARTVANQLALFDEYPEYKFLQSQPHLYYFLKNDYPELFERFKAATRTGQLIPDGGMWVEADTNIAGGESLIRQILYGKRYFKDEFGVDSRVLWLPDVFGYSGALPQILRGCGMKGFATQKITWAYNGGDPFPYNTFLWEGIDGTTIPAHIFTDYNSQTRPSSIFERWNTRLQHNGINAMIFAFGWGDGGGGPTRDHMEFLRRARDLEGLPRIIISSPAEFFDDLQNSGQPKDRYVGELYFQAHRGTYTSQAKTKQGNRRSEFALREAEFWGTIASLLNGFNFTSRSLDETWRALLLNQFHDVLPGSSIHRVYEEAESEFVKVISAAGQTAHAAASTFTTKSDALTVFNSLPWSRTALVNIVVNPELDPILEEVTIPPCGWKTIQPSAVGKPSRDETVTATLQSLENKYLLVKLNERGEITSLYDKDSRRELAADSCNQFRLYKDVPDNWDAWDIDSMAEQQPVSINEPVTLTVIDRGPLVGKIQLSRKLGNSTLTQVISLRRGSRRIDFITSIDWQESHKLLKVAFPVNIHANEAIHEIQFGHLRRPNHRSRPYDADRFEVCNHKWSALAEEDRGVAILNDCKYGLSVTGNSINLTLLKSALAPDMTADKGLQRFTYALYAWNGSLAESGIVQEAYDLNCPVLVVPGAAGVNSLFNLGAPNIVLETVKPAEDGSRDVILRLYESKRAATHCTLSTSLPVKSVIQTDMLENGSMTLAYAYGKINLDFRPFEVKTLRLRV